MSNISKLCDNLSCELIGFCLDALAEGRELWPTLAYCAKDGSGEFMSFDGDELEICLDAAREQVAKLPESTLAYAIAYDGYVQVDEDGAYADALLVEFGDKGAKTAYSLYLPYYRENGGADFYTGEPLAAGEEPLLFI